MEAHAAPGDASKAKQPGKVEKNNGVGGGEAEIERAAVVAVHYPGLTGEEATDRLLPLCSGRLHPPRSPVMRVEVDDRQAESLANLS